LLRVSKSHGKKKLNPHTAPGRIIEKREFSLSKKKKPKSSKRPGIGKGQIRFMTEKDYETPSFDKL